MVVTRVGRTLLLVLAATACAKTLQRSVTRPEHVATIDRRAPYLKVHTASGEVYVLSPWENRMDSAVVAGSGVLLGVNRDTLARGTFTIPIDSVALFETNVTHTHGAVAALAVLTGMSVGVTVYCASNPKACFGSCPTFYVSDGTRDLLQAEGFSASIAPSLEATDVDHLYRARARGTQVDVRMVNEALETHVVQSVHLLVVPRPPGTRVFAGSDGRFWRATAVTPPLACHGAEGDCLSLLAAFDGRERTSAADSTDLATREEIELAFPEGAGRFGLVLAGRQSLLPTYLLYQSLAWMGTSAGQWLAQLERGNAVLRDHLDVLTRTFSGIEVLVPRNGEWVPVETAVEAGPLAADAKVIPLPAGGSRVRLRLVKGGWRLDYAALATLEAPVVPIRLAPTRVLQRGREDADALDRLLRPAAALVTLPGDERLLQFDLPTDGTAYELFLESRGYYLEWMRDEWVAEENPARVAQLLLDPSAIWRDIAPAFARAETGLERAFWKSKYARP